MKTAAAVLLTIASELSTSAKSNLPDLRDGETVEREGIENGMYFRVTAFRGQTYRAEFDFRQKENRQVATTGECK